MPRKNPNADRIGGPGASRENARQPGKSQPRGVRPQDTRSGNRSKISGGGGERDSHHTREPRLKGGKD